MSHHTIKAESLIDLVGEIEEKRETASHRCKSPGHKCERPDLHRRDPRVFFNDKRPDSPTGCRTEQGEWVTYWCHPSELLMQAWREAGYSDGRSSSFSLSSIEYSVRPDGTESLICGTLSYIGGAVFTLAE